MAANQKTIKQILRALSAEMDRDAAIRLIGRLARETVPSGNKSYDETILRLHDAAATEDFTRCYRR